MYPDIVEVPARLTIIPSSLGSAAQLERLMQYLVAHSINDPEDITANVISAGTLTSAQFWELPNLRSMILISFA